MNKLKPTTEELDNERNEFGRKLPNSDAEEKEIK